MNNTELIISDFYHSIDVLDASLFTVAEITERLVIKVHYWSHSSAIAIHNNEYIIFINESINVQRQWQHFGHEMYHYFYDEISYGSLYEGYASYGESKADYFAYHFCVPTFMLQKIKGVDVYDVMNLFNVEFDFALRRLEMYKNNIYERKKLIEGSY